MLGTASIHHQYNLALDGESRGHKNHCPPAFRTTEPAIVAFKSLSSYSEKAYSLIMFCWVSPETADTEAETSYIGSGPGERKRGNDQVDSDERPSVVG
jgi:hypothetical protein